MIRLHQYKLGLICSMLILGVIVETLTFIACLFLAVKVSWHYCLISGAMVGMGYCTLWCIGLVEEVHRGLQHLREP